MTIAAVCPNCDAEFQVSPDLAGKAMRCPECREAFIVDAPPPPVPAPDAKPAPEPAQPGGFASGAVGDFVPVLEVEAGPPGSERPFERIEGESVFALPAPDAPPAKKPPKAKPKNEPVPVAAFARPKPAPPPPPAPTREVTWPDLPPPEDEPFAPGPKEVSWADHAPPPTAPVPAATAPAPSPNRPVTTQISWHDVDVDSPVEPRPAASPLADDDAPYIRRRRKSPWPFRIAATLALAIVALITVTGYNYLRYVAKTEERAAAEAEEVYTAGNFPGAAKKYDDLVTQFVASPSLEKYKFYRALAETRAAVDDLSVRENPDPAREKLAAFIASNENSPHAQPGTGLGADIVATGRKLADTIADAANDKLKKFTADRPGRHTEHLDAAEKLAATGDAVLPPLDRFRDKDAAGFDDQRKKFADVLSGVRKEHDRLAVLAPFRDLEADPTDDKIEEFAVTLKRSGLADDAEAAGMIDRAKAKLRELIGSVRELRRPEPFPRDPSPPVLLAAPVAGSLVPRAAPDVQPDVAFAVARGVLYALDAHTGMLLWGTRVADPAADSRAAGQLPTRALLGYGAGDGVIVASDAGGRPAVTARNSRTGEVLWYQPLEAGFAGRPVVVGRRVYVPLADPVGTVVEIQLSTGTRVGSLSLRQPIGAGLAAMPGEQPGSGYLFVPADARRVFVFEVGREADDGSREAPRCVRVIPTEHPKDSVRLEPLLVYPPAGDGPRYLVLPQNDGPTAMKLRCFTLPTAGELAAAPNGPNQPPPEAGTLVAAGEVTVPGWSWFPPATNGERVVAATDAGAVSVYGVNQAGNADAPLFPLPIPSGAAGPTPDPDAVNRSLVVAVDEDAAWVVAGGVLGRLRTAVDPANGLRVVRDGTPRPVGEPVHRANVLPGLGLAVVVTRVPGPAGFRATAFDLGSGLVRWQRQIGGVAVSPPVVRPGKPLIVADEAGGVYAVPVTADGETGPAEVLAPPVAEPLAKAQLARSADGSVVWALVADGTGGGRRLRARCFLDGVLKSDVSPALPDLPAGAAVVVGETVVVPLANGSLYRLAPGGSSLGQGPLWRSGGAGPDAVCLLAATGPADFVASDGDKQLVRWKWPTGADAAGPAKVGGPWEARDPFVMAPAVLPGGPGQRFAAADGAGAVRLFDAAKPGDHVMLWRGGAGGVPEGEPGVHLDALDVGGKPRLVYAVNRRHLVCLDPDDPDPAWDAAVVPADGPELLGWALRDGELLATDLTGRVAVYDALSGELLTDTRPAPGGLAATAAVPVGGNRAVLGLADGTLSSIPVPRRAK